MKRYVLMMALVCTAAGGARGAEDTAPIVREIVIRGGGGGELDEGFVRSHTRARAGSELSRTVVAQDVRTLLATKRYADVQVRAEPVDDGVRLVYLLTKKPRLAAPVALRGVDHFREGRVREWLGVEVGDYVDDHAMGVGAREVTAEYRKELFPDARVSWEIEETTPGASHATVTVTVKEGRRARLSEVNYLGNAGVGTDELRAIFKPRPRWNPVNWFRTAHYDDMALSEVRHRILTLYRGEGFLDARVDPPALARKPDGHVAVNIAIHEGVKYRFGDITIGGSGLKLFPEAELRGKITADKGSVASLDTIKSMAGALKDVFGSRGYIDTRVKPVFDADPATGLLNLSYDITEGEQASIRNIVVRGNSRTRDKVIRRELLVYPGEIFDEVRIRRSERIIRNLGFFSAVRSEPADTSIAGQKDLVISVEEKRTGQFMVGAGFSSIDKVLGFVELSQGNFDIKGWPYFTGGGQKLKLTGQFGSRSRDASVSFVEPWLLGRKLSFGVDVYSRRLDYTDYDVSRTGVALSLGKPLPGPNRATLTYRIERSSIRDVADTNRYVRLDSPEEDYYFTTEDDRVESSLRLTLTHDTRDNPFVATRGNRLQVYGEVAGGPLGFDTDLFGVGFQTASYLPLWFRHVVSLRTRWSVVDNYGSTDEVPLNDRLFIGGGRTIRGYDYRDVGPKVVRADAAPGSTSYRPVGGQTFALAGVEYTVPIVKALRLAAFYDIGSVWRDAYDMSFDNPASGAGVGVRIDMPGFPIRIDRAWPVRKDNDITREDTWVIWIGFDN